MRARSPLAALLAVCALASACGPAGDGATDDAESAGAPALVTPELRAAFDAEIDALRAEAEREGAPSIPEAAQAAARLAGIVAGIDAGLGDAGSGDAAADPALIAAADAFEHDCVALAAQLPRAQFAADAKTLIEDTLVKAEAFRAAWLADA